MQKFKLTLTAVFMMMTVSSLAVGCQPSTNASPEDEDEVELVIKEIESAREKGLPSDAVPLAYYFNREAYKERMVLESDIPESCIWESSGNKYIFFVQPLQKIEDGQFQYIAIWMYDEAKGKVTKAFSQSESHYGDWEVYKVELVESVIPTAPNQEVWTPMLVLGCQMTVPTGYAPYATVFLHPESGKTRLCEDEYLMEYFKPMQNTLPPRLYGQAKNYIITTTTQHKTEELKDAEGDMNGERIYLTPLLKIYTTYAELVQTIELPEDTITDIYPE